MPTNFPGTDPIPFEACVVKTRLLLSTTTFLRINETTFGLVIKFKEFYVEFLGLLYTTVEKSTCHEF